MGRASFVGNSIMKIGTKIIRAGLAPASQGEPFLAGVTFAGTYHAAGDTTSSPYTYGRYHNPTWTQFERALGELEGGPAVAFASGMAAVAESGVRVRKAPTAGDGLGGLLEGARLLWLETPANPGLDVCDIAALVDAAHKRNVLVAVDNTTPTILGQCPLDLGADYSVASDTKGLTGHCDLILGHVAVRDAALAERLLSWRNQMGAVPGPMEVWLAHRSLATLELRLEKQCRNALAIAEYLAGRFDIESVRYPGLPNDPSHEVAARQMRYFGQVIGFVLSDRARAERFLKSCELVIEATSFGGVHTTAERRARWGGDKIPEGFIRLSVGCEDAEDLIADIAQALNGV
jgi:cystathionine gamma-lyase